MRRLMLLTALLGGLCLVFTAPAVQAQTEDHLKCYKVKDPLRLKGLDAAGKNLKSWLDLTPQQFSSFQESCKIVGGLRYFCAPVEKQVDPNATIIGKLAGLTDWDTVNLDPSFSGPAEGDKICYKVKCDPSYLNNDKDLSIEIRDQFGARDVTKIKPFLLCGPAQKDCVADSQQPGCGFGYCPNATDVCQADPAGGCLCAPPGGANPPLCASESPLSCSTGLCPAGTVCQLNTAGNACQCHCPSLGCTNLNPPMCANGWCSDSNDVCQVTGTTCTCAPPETCGQYSAGQCGQGTCATGGYTCQDDGASGCVCAPPGQTCDVLYPACGPGTCATQGEVCIDNGAGSCVCAQPSCSATLPPLCGGDCSPTPSQPYCVINAGACQCQGIPDIVSNHYRLYIAFGPINPPPVSLGDQFLPDIGVDLGLLEYFAVPADKEGGGIPYPNTHGTCYDTPGGFGFAANISIVNQFGPQSLTIGELDFLFVPAQKIEPPHGLPERNEHYTCYRATGPDLGLSVTVLDQFGGPDLVTVRTPDWFCAPASKNQEDPLDELHHLTCYLIEGPGVAPGPVVYNDQFAVEQIDVGLPVALCVPSYKEAIEIP